MIIEDLHPTGTTDTDATDVDAEAVEEFALHLVGVLTGGLLTPLIEIGRRTGLFEATAAGPATSPELAARAGLEERYVREWLAALAAAGIVEYAADGSRYWLPAEHAAVLTGSSVDNLTPPGPPDHRDHPTDRRRGALLHRGRRRAVLGVPARGA